MPAALSVSAEPGQRLIDIVRELARDGRLPLYWRCGHGTCGACRVQLMHAASALALPVVLSGKERNVLLRSGAISAAERDAATLPDTPALPRLACHLLTDERDWQVHW